MEDFFFDNVSTPFMKKEEVDSSLPEDEDVHVLKQEKEKKVPKWSRMSKERRRSKVLPPSSSASVTKSIPSWAGDKLISFLNKCREAKETSSSEAASRRLSAREGSEEWDAQYDRRSTVGSSDWEGEDKFDSPETIQNGSYVKRYASLLGKDRRVILTESAPVERQQAVSFAHTEESSAKVGDASTDEDDDEDNDGLNESTEGVFRSSSEVREIYEAKCADSEQPISDAGFRRFETAVRKRSNHIDKFDLEGCGVGPKTGRVIYNILKKDARVRSLNLAKNALCDKGIKWISKLIAENGSIESVDVSGNYINPEGLVLLAEGLNKSNVKSVNVSSYHVEKNILGTQGAHAFAMLLQQESCQIETLKMNSMEPGDFSKLFVGLERNRSIKAIEVGSNKLTDIDVSNLCAALISSNVEILNISGNILGEAGAVALCDVILSSETLMHIDLSRCITNTINPYTESSLAVVFCSALGHALSEPNCTLQTLLLGENDIRDEGLLPLARAFATNGSVRELSLMSCGISKSSMKVFATALSQNGSIVHLNLKKNNLEDEGVETLMGALIHSEGSISGIQYLNVSNNFFGDKAGHAIANMLRGNDALLELCIDQNIVRDEAATDILHSICGDPRNTTLQGLSHKLNGFSRHISVKMEKALKANRELTYKTDVLNSKRMINTLKREEDRLKQVLRELEATESELQRIKEEDRRLEEGLDRWKDQEEEVTFSKARELQRLTMEGAQSIEEMNAEKRQVDSNLKNQRYEFMEKSTQLQFKISNEKRKQYSRKDQIIKFKKQLEAKVGEETRSQAFVDNLEKQLQEELLTRKSTKSFVHSCKVKLSELQSKAKEEYSKGMCKYLQEQRQGALEKKRLNAALYGAESAAAKADEPVTPQTMDMPAFLTWFFGGMPHLYSDSSKKKSAKKYIGVNEELDLVVGVCLQKGPQRQNRIIEKSHTIQSLSMHGLHNNSTVLVNLQDAILTQKFADAHFVASKKKSSPAAAAALSVDTNEEGEHEALPHEFKLRVKGGTSVPNVLRLVADKLGIESRQIRNLVYDPEEPVPVKKVTPRPSPAASSLNSQQEIVEEKINIDYMKRESDSFAGFQADASVALGDFASRWAEYERKFSEGKDQRGDIDAISISSDSGEDVETAKSKRNTTPTPGKHRSTSSKKRGSIKSKKKKSTSSSSSSSSSSTKPLFQRAQSSPGSRNGYSSARRASGKAVTTSVVRSPSNPSSTVSRGRPNLARRRTIVGPSMLKNPDLSEREKRAIRRHTWNKPHARMPSDDVQEAQQYVMGPNGRRVELIQSPNVTEIGFSGTMSSAPPPLRRRASDGNVNGRSLQPRVLPAVVVKTQVFNFSNPYQKTRFRDSELSSNRAFITRPKTAEAIERILPHSAMRRSLPAGTSLKEYVEELELETVIRAPSRHSARSDTPPQDSSVAQDSHSEVSVDDSATSEEAPHFGSVRRRTMPISRRRAMYVFASDRIDSNKIEDVDSSHDDDFSSPAVTSPEPVDSSVDFGWSEPSQQRGINVISRRKPNIPSGSLDNKPPTRRMSVRFSIPGETQLLEPRS